MNDRDRYTTFHKRRYRDLVTEMLHYFAAESGRYLDIGGGGDVGDLWAEFRACRQAEIHAVDMPAEVSRGIKKGLQSRACNIDAEPLPFRDKFFDGVLFSSVVEHLYNPALVFKEIRRVLKPGSVLIVETPNAVALGRRLRMLLGQNPFSTFHKYNLIGDKAFLVECALLYTVEDVKRLLEGDFEIVNVRYSMHSPEKSLLRRAIRAVATHLCPALSDCFIITAKKK